MKYCEKCGLPLGFKKITSGKAAGKWCPTNPDGSDHWDTCREERLKDPVYRAYVEEMDRERMQPTFTHATTNVFWDDELPPWDESLGVFRKEIESRYRSVKISLRERKKAAEQIIREYWAGEC